MNNTSKKPSILQIIISVLAAMFGVQKSENRTRDFAQKSPWPYIITGIIMTALFVGLVILAVKLVLATAT